MASYVLHGNPYILQEYRDAGLGTRPSFLKLLDLIDMDDPTWPATAAALREMTEAGVEIDEAAVGIAAKLGAHRLARLDEIKIHGREAPYDGWTAGGPFKSIVYYIRRGPVVKIGTTAGAISRFTDLMPDEILAFEPGGNKEETFRHRQFAHLRCHGEHFRPEPELMEHIHRVREQYGDPPVDWPTVAILAKDTNIRMALAPLKSEEMITAEEACDRWDIREEALQRWVQRRKLSPAAYGQYGEEMFYAEHVAALLKDPREASRWLSLPQRSLLCNIRSGSMYLEPPGLSRGAFRRIQEVGVAEGSLNLDALLSAKDAALYTGKSINAIVNWRNRGWLPVATDAKGNEIRDGRGRPRYRLLDVAKAENATRQRGEKMASRIVRRDPEQRLAA